MGHTTNFFESKKDWSRNKDAVLERYLTPYTAKILNTHKPLVIIDCFAGKGKFDDGSAGSPIIIANHIRSVLENDRGNKNISGLFIESKYAKDLETNLNGYKNCGILHGTFKEHLDKILALNSQYNVFLYIDPYGVKCLDFQQFEQIKAKQFSSLEMILNFNFIAFWREGHRLLGLDYEDLFSNGQCDDEYELDEANNIGLMNNVAHGEYWQHFIRENKNKTITAFEAEERFINKYMEEIKKLFTYAVNIPIRLKRENVPKYRLIFGSNHQDGFILMADNMSGIWKKLRNVQSGGQKALFEYDFPDTSIQPGFDLKEGILKVLKKHKDPLFLQDLLVELFRNYQIAFSEKEYKGKIKEMEGNQILVDRYPALTEKGKKATALNYRDYKITVGLKP
ncbi:MAG: three-Cys-motif partner protein TcmP [Planctomycetota bacterium]